MNRLTLAAAALLLIPAVALPAQALTATPDQTPVATPAPTTTQIPHPQPKAPPPLTAAPYTMLYVFGDSYSDIGAGYIDGNGLTSVAYLARRLDIPFTYYGAPGMLDKGIDFAVSGARSGAGTGRHFPGGALLSFGMVNQVQEFADLVQSGKLHFDPSQTMFFLAGGLNDRGTPPGTTRKNEDDEIDTLYALGARRFMVALLPTRIPAFATAGEQFNPDIEQIPADERAKHPDIRIATSDWGLFYDQVLTHPAEYGLTDTTSICAGRALKDQDPTPCASPETHFYYHQGHPSTATHKDVGEMLYQEALTKAP